jgi:hypothetical protein
MFPHRVSWVSEPLDKVLSQSRGKSSFALFEQIDQRGTDTQPLRKGLLCQAEPRSQLP